MKSWYTIIDMLALFILAIMLNTTYHRMNIYEQEYNEQRLAKAKTKLSIYKQRDKNRESYASKTNLGKSVVKQILMGPIGSGSYSRYRSSGNSRVMAFLKSNVISSLLSSPVTVPLSRHREMKTAKKQLGIKKK